MSSRPPSILVEHALTLILVIAALTRLPFIFAGYGADLDAWLVAQSALTLWTTGVYEVSRFPGYPLHEFLMAPFVAWGGHVLSNGVTLVAALVLVFFWHRLAHRTVSHPVILTIAFAFTPLFWKVSVVTMDYIWTLLFMVLALNDGLRNRTVSAGLWLGIAAGFRPTTLLAILPLAALIHLNMRSGKGTIRFIGSTIAMSLVALSPLMITYGFSGWIQNTIEQTSDIAFTTSERILLFGYRLVYSIGPLALISALTITTLHRGDLLNRLRASDPLITSCVTGIVCFVLLFMVFPLEREYLLPALPFLLLLLDRLATRRMLLVFTAFLISFAFVNIDVIIHEGTRGRPGFNIHEGYVLDDWNRRHLMVETRRAERMEGHDSPEPR